MKIDPNAVETGDLYETRSTNLAFVLWINPSPSDKYGKFVVAVQNGYGYIKVLNYDEELSPMVSYPSNGECIDKFIGNGQAYYEMFIERVEKSKR